MGWGFLGFLSPPFCLFASVLYTYNSMYMYYACVHGHAFLLLKELYISMITGEQSEPTYSSQLHDFSMIENACQSITTLHSSSIIHVHAHVVVHIVVGVYNIVGGSLCYDSMQSVTISNMNVPSNQTTSCDYHMTRVYMCCVGVWCGDVRGTAEIDWRSRGRTCTSSPHLC